MSDDETVSRRQLFSGWARGLRDGFAEWVLPELEREAERLKDAFESTGLGEGPGVEAVHPWRDLLEPREWPESPESPEPRGDGADSPA